MADSSKLTHPSSLLLLLVEKVPSIFSWVLLHLEFTQQLSP